MKKILFLVCFLCFTSTAFAGVFGDFNMRFGYDFSGKMKSDNSSVDAKYGGAMSFEYLFNILGYLKLGPGFEIAAKTYESKNSKDLGYDGISGASIYVPVYLSVQVHPFSTVVPGLKGIFVKGNLGYNVAYAQADLDNGASTKGGMYYAVAGGYKFPFGLFADLTYAIYKSKIDGIDTKTLKTVTSDMEHSTLRLNLGWSF